MNIEKNTVVQFHYVLKDEQGKVIEDSHQQTPIAILMGHNNMIKGVEDALMGKQKGESFSVTLAPADAYGEYVEDALQRVPAKHLQGATKWQPGMVAIVNTDQGQRQVTVVKTGRFMITVDTNHPYAGQTLIFDIDIIDVREAQENEIAHGHAHGVGGHHHD